MTKAAIYVRVSTTNQAIEGYSVEEQERSLKKYCEAMGWLAYDVYTDAGYTGSNIDRPALKKMLIDAEFKKFNTVLVYKLDRLSRSVSDTLTLVKDKFNSKGIEFVSMKENIDTSTPMGNFFLTILSAIAEFERDQITERMKMGKVGRAKEGLPMNWTGKYKPYGYDYTKENGGQYIINKYESQSVKEVYKRYLDGESITSLVDSMNKFDPKRKWSYRNVRTILDNPVYMGKISYLGEIYDGQHEAIVSPEAFEKTQDELKKRQIKAYKENNNPRPFQTKYLVSGLIRCGHCGAPMSVSMGTVRLDGTRPKYYRCRSASITKAKKYRLPHCKESKSVNLYDVEEEVLNIIQKLKLNPEQIENKIEKVSTVEHEKELKKISEKLERLIDLYIDNKIDKQAYDNRKSKLEKSKEEYENIIYELKQKENESKTYDVIDALESFENIHDLDYQTQKKIVQKIIHQVTVTNGNIDITLTF